METVRDLDILINRNKESLSCNEDMLQDYSARIEKLRLELKVQEQLKSEALLRKKELITEQNELNKRLAQAKKLQEAAEQSSAYAKYVSQCLDYLKQEDYEDLEDMTSAEIIEAAQEDLFETYFPDWESNINEEYDDMTRLYLAPITCECEYDDEVQIYGTGSHEDWCHKRFCDEYVNIPKDFSDPELQLLNKKREDLVYCGRIA